MHKIVSKDAFVMLAHCGKTKELFGITVDKMGPGNYSLIWAFKLNPKQAKNEGFQETKVDGSIEYDAEYPGCPYCGRKDLVFCSCGGVVCYDGEGKFYCPKCGQTGKVTYAEKFSLHGGGY